MNIIVLKIVVVLTLGLLAHEAKSRYDFSRERQQTNEELRQSEALYATAPEVAPPGWHLTSDRFWLKTFTSDDGRWRIESFATDPFGMPRGWVLIDARDEQADVLTRPGSFNEVLAYTKENAQ